MQHNDGWTPLHWAAGFGYIEVANLLLAAGADVNAKDKHRQTALLMASPHGYAAVQSQKLIAGSGLTRAYRPVS